MNSVPAHRVWYDKWVKQCAVDGCDKLHLARGFCKPHYRKWRRSPEAAEAFPEASVRRCSVDGCDDIHQGHGYCQKHYTRWKTYGDPLTTKYNMDGPKKICSVADCDRAVKAKGLCPKHHLRAVRNAPLTPERERGDGWVNAGGYVFKQVQKRAIAEHRLVMERHLGRELLPHETVHHRNGDRSDNRLSNLELWSSSHPRGQRAIDKLRWAREIIALYETERGRLESK